MLTSFVRPLIPASDRFPRALAPANVRNDSQTVHSYSAQLSDQRVVAVDHYFRRNSAHLTTMPARLVYRSAEHSVFAMRDDKPPPTLP